MGFSKDKARALLFAELPTLVAPERLKNEPLLPNVQTIRWTAHLPRVLLFISPSLKSLTLNVLGTVLDEDRNAARQCFNGLTVFPKLDLESFRLVRPRMEARFMEGLLPFLQRQQNLKALEISSESYLDPHTVQGMLFPNLPTGLRELGAEVEFHDESEYKALTQTIIQRLPNLRVIKLLLTSLGSWDLSDFDNLSPFLQNSNLEELTLYVSEMIGINTRDIHALGRALPHMARLNLRLQSSGLPALSVQASSLIDFAKAFPNLQLLVAHVVCINVPISSPSHGEAAGLDAAKLPKLKILNVGRSSLPQHDVARMAELLARLRLHPLFKIEWYGKGKYSEDSVRSWRDVEAMVKLIQRPNPDSGKSDPDRTLNN